MTEILEKENHWPSYQRRWTFKGDAGEAVLFAGSMAGYEARTQYEFMLSKGLQPDHQFLDLGCGCLRGTIRLLNYLRDGNFYGADVSMGLLKAAIDERERLKTPQLPILQLMEDFDLPKLFDVKFDYILSVSVIPYLYPDDIPDFLKGVVSVLAPEGKAFLTLYSLPVESEENFRIDPYLTWYKPEYLIEEGKKAGLVLSEPKERFINRIPSKAPPLLSVVNSKLSEWVLEGTRA
jgi:ubiquinone/menaquinone biosynthesis C-methylase UbiE